MPNCRRDLVAHGVRTSEVPPTNGLQQRSGPHDGQEVCGKPVCDVLADSPFALPCPRPGLSHTGIEQTPRIKASQSSPGGSANPAGVPTRRKEPAQSCDLAIVSPCGRGTGSQQDAGVENGVGVERALGCRQGIAEEGRTLGLVPRHVVAAHSMMVGDRASRLDQRVGSNPLDLLPLFNLAARSRREARRDT